MKNDKSTNEPDLASFVKEKTSEHYINEYLYRMEEVNVHLYGVRNPISCNGKKTLWTREDAKEILKKNAIIDFYRKYPTSKDNR